MKTTVLHDIAFGQGGNSTDYQLYGWSFEENGFNWTLGEESALLFPRSDSPCGYCVESFVFPRVRPEGPHIQRLSVSMNGVALGSIGLRQSCTIAFFAPPIRRHDRQIVITFGHPDGFRAVPDSPDFAISFAKVRLRELEEPLAEATHRSSGILLPDEDGLSDAVSKAIEEASGLARRELAMQFEMLAGNCEFGGVQRLVGAEPLGLLRFAGAVPETAIRGLDCDFEGMGQQITPFMAPDGSGEWMVSDPAYNLQYHTAIMLNQTADGEAVARAEKRKVAFLIRKFLEDWDEGRKIYVCADLRGLPDEAMLPLFLAACRRGPRKLLWVREASDQGKIGTVEERYPGLMVGYIDRYIRPGRDQKPSIRGWLNLLLNAWILAGNTMP